MADEDFTQLDIACTIPATLEAEDMAHEPGHLVSVLERSVFRKGMARYVPLQLGRARAGDRWNGVMKA